MSLTFAPSFRASALKTAARLVVCSMSLMPCWVNLMFVMNVATGQSPCTRVCGCGQLRSVAWDYVLFLRIRGGPALFLRHELRVGPAVEEDHAVEFLAPPHGPAPALG